MSKEKDWEKFSLEYCQFEVDSCSTLMDTKSYIDVVLGDLDDHINMFKEEIKDNNISKIRTLLSNYFSFIIGYEYPEYYDEDSYVLKREVSVNKLFNGFLLKLLDVVNESNFLEVFKLCCFIRNKYFSYYCYLEKERSGVEMMFHGCSMYVPEPFNIDDFILFLNDEINRISLSRNVEKKKVL